ncbi:hypothetical protein ACS0TY_008626 [Phlomoides rotata]
MKGVARWCVVVIVVVLVVAVHETAAVDCNPLQLSPCLEAISEGKDPSAECCSRLKEQQPCFCGYLKNPVLKPYFDSPNAKKVRSVCGLSTLTC